MAMRIYIHYEAGPDHTHVWKMKQERPSDVHTVCDLIKEFVIVYNKKHGTVRRLDESKVDLLDQRRRKLLGNAQVLKVLQDRADVYIVEKNVNVEKHMAENKKEIRPRDGSSSRVAKCGSEFSHPKSDNSLSRAVSCDELKGMPEGQAGKASLKTFGDGSNQATAGVLTVEEARGEAAAIAPVVKDLLTKALDMEKIGNYKYAIRVFEEVLAVFPTQRTCLRGLASMALAISNYKRAAKFLEIAVSAYPRDELFHARLGDAYYHLRHYEKALQQFDAASMQLRNEGGSTRQAGILQSIGSNLQESQRDLSKGRANNDDEKFFRMGGTTSLLAQKLGGAPHETSKMVTDILDCYAGDLQGPVTLEDLKLASARALHKLGYEPFANHIIMSMLKENGDHRGALFEYGVIALERGMHQDALRVFLRLLVMNQTDKRVKEQAAEVLQKPEGVKYLCEELVNVKESSAVLAFMASTIKDYGAVKEAVTLFQKAHDADPGSASYVLNLVHTLEVCNRYCEALYRGGIYCKRYMDMQLGPLLRLHDVWQTLQGLLVSIAQRDYQDMMEDLTMESLPETGCWLLRFHDLIPTTKATNAPQGDSANNRAKRKSSGEDGDAAACSSEAPQSNCKHQDASEDTQLGPASIAVCPTLSQQVQTQCVTQKGTGVKESLQEGSDPIECSMDITPQENVQGEVENGQNENTCGSSSIDVGRGSPILKCDNDSRVVDHDMEAKKPNMAPVLPENYSIGSSVEYTANQLDALALVFAIVKILFVGGALQRALGLAEVVETARLASCKPLHTTSIRNEAAYFSCCRQIMQEYPVPLPLPSGTECPPLFLAGDSHCLSAAWNTVVLRGVPRLLTPLLVTGLKVWHLREESKFFPKLNFHKVVEGIPDGSQVVMVFGEIDCREGLLVSVDKGRYKDVAEGAAVSAGIYIEVLLKLIRERKFEIFVHPVPPVLNETRPVVCMFTKILQKEVLAAGRLDEASGRLHWLDFFDDLLDSTGNLQDKYKLDGTHLSPRYTELVRRELMRF